MFDLSDQFVHPPTSFEIYPYIGLQGKQIKYFVHFHSDNGARQSRITLPFTL